MSPASGSTCTASTALSATTRSRYLPALGANACSGPVTLSERATTKDATRSTCELRCRARDREYRSRYRCSHCTALAESVVPGHTPRQSHGVDARCAGHGGTRGACRARPHPRPYRRDTESLRARDAPTLDRTRHGEGSPAAVPRDEGDDRPFDRRSEEHTSE